MKNLSSKSERQIDGAVVLKRIYDYDNYREFLQDFYAISKAQNKNFSFRVFSRQAGMSSPSSLKRVIEGERNLSLEGIDKFAKALKLNKEESLFFKNLVQFNQAKTADEKGLFARELMRSRAYKKLHPFSEAQFNCLAQWHFLPIRELTNLPDFKEDPDWIAKKLNPPIASFEAKKALEELVRLKLLERNAQGRLVQTNSDISTGDEVVGSGVAQYHREMLKKAGESIDNVSRDKRDISAMTLGMSEKTAKKIKEMIQNFRKEIVEVVSQDEDPPNSVYQLGLQLFPVVRADDEKNK